MKEYLVMGKVDGEAFAVLKTAKQIIDYIDMSDCYEYDEYHVWDVSKPNKVTELVIHGCWHDPKNPLYIKVTTKRGKVVFDGFGTDH